MQVFLTFNTILIKNRLTYQNNVGLLNSALFGTKNVKCLLVLENGIQKTFNFEKYFNIKVRYM